MGAQWKHSGRIESSSKRGAQIGKIAKEIAVAAKISPNIDSNPRLRIAVENAKKVSMPRDTIERAIKKGAGLLKGEADYETVLYEGFAPHQVPVIVECLTDNRNRTASEVRILFRAGQLGNSGSVGWMFNRMGVVEATHPDASLDRETVAIEVGAQEVEPLEATAAGLCGARFISDPSDLDSVSKAVGDMGWTVSLSELSYLPKSIPDLTPEQMKEVTEFLQALDDHDDVRMVYAAMK